MKTAQRGRILSAARELCAEHGVGRVTTQQIAARADVAIGTLYLYASTKAELLIMVQNEKFAPAIDDGLLSRDPRLERDRPNVDDRLCHRHSRGTETFLGSTQGERQRLTAGHRVSTRQGGIGVPTQWSSYRSRITTRWRLAVSLRLPRALPDLVGRGRGKSWLRRIGRKSVSEAAGHPRRQGTDG